MAAFRVKRNFRGYIRVKVTFFVDVDRHIYGTDFKNTHSRVGIDHTGIDLFPGYINAFSAHGNLDVLANSGNDAIFKDNCAVFDYTIRYGIDRSPCKRDRLALRRGGCLSTDRDSHQQKEDDGENAPCQYGGDGPFKMGR